MKLFDSELTEENIKLEKGNINWQEKLNCSILTRKEAYALTSRTDEYYVYILWKMYSDTPVPFYIGKGHFDRIIKHETPSDNQNIYKNKIINKHQNLDINVGYSILNWHKHEEEAYEQEAKLIALIGRADLKQGTLSNKTDGGDGTRGHLSPKRGDNHSARAVCAIVNGVSFHFACVADCAEALNVDSSLILARIKNGWPGYFYKDEGQRPVIDKYRGFYRKTVHTPDGIFESLAEAGRQLNISHKQIHKWICRGWKGYYYVDEGQRSRRCQEKSVKIAGIEFQSQKEAAQVFGITPSSLKKRLESSNYPDWIDLSGSIKKHHRRQPLTAVWIGQVKYNSLIEAEKVTGIKRATLAARAASSNYADTKIENVIKVRRSEKMAKLAVSVTVDSKKYQTLSDASRFIGIDINTIKKRCSSPSFPNYISTDPNLQKKQPKDGRPSLCRIFVYGVQYRSINAASKAIGIRRDKLKAMALDITISSIYFEI